MAFITECRTLGTHTEFTEAALIARIREGDENAFQAIFDEWYARLVLYADRFLLSPGESEEIVSEAFLKCWQRRTKFDALPKMKSFLYTTVHNASLNAMRKQNTRPLQQAADLQMPFDDPYALPQDIEIIRAEISGALFREIERMEGRMKEVLLFTYRDGFSTEEIAQRLGISPSTVNSHRSRAIAQLRIALADKYPFATITVITSLLGKFL